MKKVCILTSYPFVYDSRILKEATALVQAGFSVTVICPLASMDIPVEEVISGIKVKRVLKFWLPFVPLNRFERNEARTFLRAAVHEGADIYHASNVDTLFYAYYASKRNHVPFVYDSREYWRGVDWGKGFPFYKRLLFRVYIFFFELMLAHKASAVITVNMEIARLLKRNLFLSSIPSVVMNIPEKSVLKKSSLRSDLGLTSGKLLVYCGTFGRDRAILEVITAMKYLPKEVYLVIIGYGLEEEKYRDYISENNLTARVFILPPLNYSKIISYISAADIGIVPTIKGGLSSQLSIPNKFFEYSFAGVVLAVSNVPTLAGLVKKYHVGVVFNPKDPTDIAKKIKFALEDKNFKMFKSNTQHIEKDFDWDKEKEKYVELIEKALRK